MTPTGDPWTADVERAAEFGALATAALLVGAGQAMLESSVDYAKQRSQFGRVIGSYQAIKHKLADVHIALELARPLVYGAALSLAEDSPETRRDVSAAKVAASEAALLAARSALQTHGAIGFTSEHDLSLWLLRVQALRSAWGDPPHTVDGCWRPSVSEERALLIQTVRDLVGKHAAPEAVRAAMDSEAGYDTKLWQLLCEQVGVAALLVPEDLGGAGGELGDAAAALAELGRHLVPTPLLGTLLVEWALLSTDEPDAQTLEALAAGEATGAVVFDAGHVVGGAGADVLIAVQDGQLMRLTEFTAHP